MAGGWQMDIFDQILENLELERDLGMRTVEIDRALLVPPSAVSAAPPPPPKPAAPASAPADTKVEVPPPSSAGPVPVQEPPAASPSRAASPTPQCDVAFFTGRPLSPAGQEAMTKTFAAMRRIRPDTTIRLNEECSARVIVLLGSDALAKRLPAARPIRGAWVDVAGTPAIMTFSPDYIFTHFQDGSPNMNKAKLEMWNDIKLAVARL
jgi:hypothetical protein